MLGIGWSEALVIGVLALLFIPTEDLPRVARELGKKYGQLRRTADDLRRSFMLEADRQDAQERFAELQERRKKMEGERQKRLAEAQSRGAVDQAGPPPPTGGRDPASDAGTPRATLAVLTAEEDPETPAVRRPLDSVPEDDLGPQVAKAEDPSGGAP